MSERPSAPPPVPGSSPPLSPLAARLAAAGQSASWAIADEALRRAATGEDILLLTLGDPPGPPHPAIVAATKAALDAGRTHYTSFLGEPRLRAAIAERNGVRPEEVAVLPGAQHGCFAALSLIAGPGDEVVLSDPHYATYPGIVAATGARARKVAVRPDLSIDLDSIEAVLGPETRAIFLNSPANPTGAALSIADYQRLSAMCAKRDLWLVVDEVYAEFGFSGAIPRAYDHGPAGRTISVNSLSKSHAMTGFRVGWVLAPAPLVHSLQDWAAAATFGVSQFVQDGALAAIQLPASELAGYRSGFARRARLVVDQASRIPGFRASLPAGGMFLLLDCSAVDADDTRIARRLLDEAKVAIMPGSAFGNGARGHLRVSLTPDEETLTHAFRRIARLLQP